MLSILKITVGATKPNLAITRRIIALLFSGETTVITNELKRGWNNILLWADNILQWFGKAIARIMYQPLAHLMQLSQRQFGFLLRIHSVS